MDRFRAALTTATIAAFLSGAAVNPAWSDSDHKGDDLKGKKATHSTKLPKLSDHKKTPLDVGHGGDLANPLGLGGAAGLGASILGNVLDH
jgi:hypothetical protein